MSLDAGSAVMHERPDSTSIAVSQLLHGEAFHLLDVIGDWAWGFSQHDHYVGYVPRHALGQSITPTHIVTAQGAPIFAAPDIKAPAVANLPAGALVEGEEGGSFIGVAQGFLHVRHVARIDAVTSDWTGVATAYLGQPYLWGGRGCSGIDCSGLVQVALGRCGIAAPRDTDLQREAIGEVLADDAPLRRGDFVFFPGHVGIMADETNLLHANAHWMATVIEPLDDVVARLSTDHALPVLARRRLSK